MFANKAKISLFFYKIVAFCIKRAMILLVEMLFYIAESLLGNSDIDVARY